MSLNLLISCFPWDIKVNTLGRKQGILGEAVLIIQILGEKVTAITE